MEQMMQDFIINASVTQKGWFLMVTGISFVFAVQVIFYSIVKFWPKGKQD